MMVSSSLVVNPCFCSVFFKQQQQIILVSSCSSKPINVSFYQFCKSLIFQYILNIYYILLLYFCIFLVIIYYQYLKFPNFNNDIVLYFGGYWVLMYSSPKRLIKLMSGIFLLGLHQPQELVFLPVIILVMFLYIFGCMCLWVFDHSHTTYFIYCDYLFWVHHLLFICSSVKCH